MCTKFFLIAILFFPYNTSAQDRSVTERMEREYQAYLERITGESEPEEAEEIIEAIESLRVNPLNVHTLTHEDLLRLPFLELNTSRIIHSRIHRLDGTMEGVEFIAKGGVDEELIYLLMNFISFEPQVVNVLRRDKPSVSIRSRIVSDIQDRLGITEGVYRGNKFSSYQRIVVKKGDGFDAGFLGAKYAGEKYFLERRSGYLRFRAFGNRIRLLFGDFQVRTGTGLLLWNGFGFSKGSQNTVVAVRNGHGITPALSPSNDSKFRGVSVEIDLPRIRGIVFYSYILRHAVVHNDGTIRNISASPVFRTEAEMNRKNTLRERMYGYSLSIRLRRDMYLGTSVYRLGFDLPFKPDLPNRFSGYKNTHASVDVKSTIGAFSVNGEVATAYSELTPAIMGSTFIRLASGVETGLVYRNYPSNYSSFYGFAFGERKGAPEDETGLYFGIRLRTPSRYLLEAYGDLFRSGNKGRRPGLPAIGADYLVRMELPLPRRGIFEIRARQRRKEEFIIRETLSDYHRVSVIQSRKQFRGTVTILHRKSLRVRARFEYTSVSMPERLKQTGNLILSEIRWQPLPAFTIESRYTVFDTDSFDSRLYIFEYDAPGRMRSVQLLGQGSAFSVALRWRKGPVSGSIKYSEIFRADQNTIGTGFQQIDGPVSGVLIGQLDFRF
jgi:hypothetical protein